MTIINAITRGDDWKELPLLTLLYEWLLKNMTMPTDTSTIIAYISLFLIMWYAIVWITRFIMTIIWPLFLLASAMVVFRILQYYEPDEIRSIMYKTYTIVADTLVMIVSRGLEGVQSFFD